MTARVETIPHCMCCVRVAKRTICHETRMNSIRTWLWCHLLERPACKSLNHCRVGRFEKESIRASKTPSPPMLIHWCDIRRRKIPPNRSHKTTHPNINNRDKMRRYIQADIDEIVSPFLWELGAIKKCLPNFLLHSACLKFYCLLLLASSSLLLANQLFGLSSSYSTKH